MACILVPLRLHLKLYSIAKVATVEHELMEWDVVIKMIKEKIHQAQNWMKKVYNAKDQEREFMVGDMVYLKLQPYRQQSLSLRKNFKLSTKYYGPFKVLQRIGAVAYKLELPIDAWIHPIFHVSLLKKQVGTKVVVQTQLPTMDADNELSIPKPMAILDSRMRKRRREVLIQWQGMPSTEATWERVDIIKTQFPDTALVDKNTFFKRNGK
ncbi:Ty3/gypsy retrotransposon protein [Quillaja saponaria]|uniref:Ty3/gypsy retrotransposon protein n=1 Tax=Quillaja saponaria TaxID=32244 RepID=A0AAD7VL81_QUISA|nr:Ty3/gypsy retrotransposon protein [Quillaja saponaria]